MPSPDALAEALRSVVAIRVGTGSVIGTGVAVGDGAVLTALHVVDAHPGSQLYIAGGIPVSGILTLATRRFGRNRRQAMASHRRSAALTGYETATVDLALLTVPNLAAPPAKVRLAAVQPGERVAIAGYPNGRWTVSAGPVTSTDGVDYVVHVLLGPGSSGSPALDGHGQVCGLLTMDHLTAGAILIGPGLLTAFTTKACPQHCRWCGPRPG